MMPGLGPIPRRVPLPVGSCLTWVTSDPHWLRKVGIGAGLFLASLAILPLPFLLGYGTRVVRAAFAGGRMPDWIAWGRLYAEGLGVLAVWLAHATPVAAALWGFHRVTHTEGFGSSVLPVLLVMPFAIAIGLYLPIAQLRFAASLRFGAAFEVGENVDFLRRNFGNFGRLVVVLMVTGMVNQLGPFLCCVGVFPVGFWVFSTYHYALGELGRCDQALFKEWEDGSRRRGRAEAQ